MLIKNHKASKKLQLGIHTINHLKKYDDFSECNKSESLGNTYLVK